MRPQFYSFRQFTGDPQVDRAEVVQAARMMRREGVTWGRYTLVNEQHQLAGTEEPFGCWIEGWLERPEKEAEFNPPLVAAQSEE